MKQQTMINVYYIISKQIMCSNRSVQRLLQYYHTCHMSKRQMLQNVGTHTEHKRMKKTQNITLSFTYINKRKNPPKYVYPNKTDVRRVQP